MEKSLEMDDRFSNAMRQDSKSTNKIDPEVGASQNMKNVLILLIRNYMERCSSRFHISVLKTYCAKVLYVGRGLSLH